MVTKRNIRWIPLLMIISQLMLAGFVAYWLASQYREERDIMHAELFRLYDESHNQMIDSLLLQKVVVPALKDSVTITMMTTESNDSSSVEPGQVVHAEGIFKTGNDMLIRSVKLFITHSGDSTIRVSSGMGFAPGPPDTALFRKVYQEKIEQRHLGVTLSWIEDSSLAVGEMWHSEKLGSKGLYVTSRMPDGLPGVKVLNGFPYLLGRITPQILFALILLLLTGSAFYFTYKSLRRQMILNGLRNDFVSNITHELKTPVSTVKVALEALKTFDKAKNPEKTREYLEMAGMEMDRLDRLITKVLDQSLIGEQNQVIQPQLNDLVNLTRTTIENLQPRIYSRNARIELVCDPAPDPIMVDPLHFQGVISNLIDNSLKYGNDAPVIQITIRQEKHSVIIEVADNGPGIPEPYLGRVFDKFFRVPNDNRHNIKGYGLGLSFAALVMEQHHGSIKVRNLPQAGCTFTLTFPATTP